MRPDELRRVVELACAAPSIHDTRPWRFRTDGRVLDLHADRDRQLAVLDPFGRQLTVSCGAALLYARLALSAAGVEHRVHVMPDPDDLDHVARLTPTGRRPPDTDEVLLAAVMPGRATDRGRRHGERLPEPMRRRLEADAAAEGGWLRWVDTAGDRTATAVLVTRAIQIEEADPDYRAELRRFRRDGAPPEPARGGRAAPADLVVVGTDFDGPAGWLSAGQATARVLLRLAAGGAVASLAGQVLDVPWTRQQLRLRLGLVGYPQMLLRVGYPTAAPAAPRRPVSAVLDAVPLAAVPMPAVPLPGAAG